MIDGSLYDNFPVITFAMAVATCIALGVRVRPTKVAPQRLQSHYAGAD